MFCKQEATQTAKADNAALLKALPFSDRQSLAHAKRGLVAPVLNDGVVKNTEDRVVWDLRVCKKIGIKYELA